MTGNCSGLDPDISGQSALHLVAQARHLDPAKVHALAEDRVHGRVLGTFREPHVNVLEVNEALEDGGAR